MRECDMGSCHEVAIAEFIGVSGRSFRTARACAEHAQLLADYCAKPVEEWRDDYEPVARYDYDRRCWVPILKVVR